MTVQDDDVIIKPGGPPPFLIPWCASCDQPVERFTFDPVVTPFYAGVQAECHGQTKGIRISSADLIARKYEGKKVVMFQKVTGANTVR